METQHELVGIQSPRKSEAEQEPPVLNGAEQMRIAADIVLREKSLDIADALADSSKQGHIQCAKFLYDLAERYGAYDRKQAEEQDESIATRWAAEAEWTRQSSEESAETSGGSREPEG
jgi:hypothetical protein